MIDSEIIATIEERVIRLNNDIISFIPSSRERSLALMKLEECMMWIKAIPSLPRG